MAPPKGKLSQDERSHRMRKRMEYAFMKQFPRCSVKVMHDRALSYLQIDKVVRFVLVDDMETRIYSLDSQNNATLLFNNHPKDGDRDRRMKSHDRMWRLFMASAIGQEKIMKWNALPTQTKARDIIRSAPIALNTKVVLSIALAERIAREPSVQGLSLDESVNKLLTLQLDYQDDANSDDVWANRCIEKVKCMPVGQKFSITQALAGMGPYNGFRLRILIKALKEAPFVRCLPRAEMTEVNFGRLGSQTTLTQFEKIKAPE